jgi:sigma-70-like protein
MKASTTSSIRRGGVLPAQSRKRRRAPRYSRIAGNARTFLSVQLLIPRSGRGATISCRPRGAAGQKFEETLIHLDTLYKRALRLTHNRTEAEDVVQETYLRGFRHFDRFDPGTNCRAWLFTILRNCP